MIGVVLGLRILPPIFAEVGILIISLIVIQQIINKEITQSLSNLSYLLLLEPYTRIYLTAIPYLFLQYLIIILFLAFQFNRTVKNKVIPIWLVFFFIALIFEVLNATRTIEFRFTRSVLLNSLTMASFIMLGNQVKLSTYNLSKLFHNLSFAGFLLTGIVAVAHFQGNINYGTESNFDSSNGLAPVQLSFYLSFTLVITYIYYLKFENMTNKLLYLTVIAIQCTIMILTFSRGGLYFFGAMFILLNLEVISKAKINLSYIIGLILLIPIGNYIFDFTNEQTSGAVIDRYAEEGVSNRDILIEVGINIFQDNPLFGVGTGNFNLVAADPKYFGEISGAHNEFVRFLAEHGFLGFVFYVFFFIFLISKLIEYRHKIHLVIIPIILILAFNFGSIHNGLKLSLQSFTLFIAIAYSNYFIYNKSLK